MNSLKLNTAYRLTFYMVDVQDSISPKTGLSAPTVVAVKVNTTVRSATAISAASWTEVSAVNAPGLYTLDITAAESDTLGELAIRISHPSAREQVRIWTIVKADYGNIFDLWEAQFGKWTIDITVSPKTLNMYKSDGTTILKQFSLTEILQSDINPISARTPI